MGKNRIGMKMLIETAQMLSTAINLLDPGFYAAAAATNSIYKPTHQNHPCVRWLMVEKEHFCWLVTLFLCMHEEYKFRFEKVHLSFFKVYPAALGFVNKTIPQAELEKMEAPQYFADVSGQTGANVHKNYQRCLFYKWKNDKRIPTWTRRLQPWFIHALNHELPESEEFVSTAEETA